MSASAQRPTIPCSPKIAKIVSPDEAANDNASLRTSARPTVPIGPPLVMILSEPFADITPLALPSV